MIIDVALTLRAEREQRETADENGSSDRASIDALAAGAVL